MDLFFIFYPRRQNVYALIFRIFLLWMWISRMAHKWYIVSFSEIFTMFSNSFSTILAYWLSLYLKSFSLTLCLLNVLAPIVLFHAAELVRYSSSRYRSPQIPKSLLCSGGESQLSFPSIMFDKLSPASDPIPGKFPPTSQLLLSHSGISDSS